ncbi:MAG: lysine--tRNA ligase [Candidatus Peribacteraceae bacterium]|nr:lysine--tRNA ligase [Candidatus Peribacteraceae bacterium]
MDEFRLQKAQQLRDKGEQPFASHFDRSHLLGEAQKQKDGKSVSIAGRIKLWREMGKVIFAVLQDQSGTLQIAFRTDSLSEEDFESAKNLIDLGDFIGIQGERFTTQKGEPTVLVKEWTMLTKSLRQPPEKWHGIEEKETAWRQRYLDTMSNKETFDRFMFRSNFIRLLREFYWKNGFTEVETPTLVNTASGALATPFSTHHEAYDMDVFLRIAPETFLKECLVGGFDRVFEVARCFRNEGLDPSHLQDFTIAEHYSAYWNYEENMRFTEKMLPYLIKELTGSLIVSIPDRDGNLIEVDFTPPWPRLNIRDALFSACKIDIHKMKTANDLRKAIEKNGIKLDVDINSLERGNLIDQLYKKVCRPSLIQPTFLTEHPIDLSPLARRNDDNPIITDRFQLVVGGWEIVNAYSELVDPVDQAERFLHQSDANKKGDSDAHEKDDEYVKALEYGCPPCSGWGMGIDRIVALITQQTNLRDVVLFPLMRPTENTPNTIQKTEPNSNTLLLQHTNYGHLLPAAHGLLEEHAKNIKAHLIAMGATMAVFAKKFGGDENTWKVAGMLHDLDWDHLEKDAEEHCGMTLEKLLEPIEAPQELLADIRAHYQEKYSAEHPLDTQLRKTLFCIDELTGFIIAVTLVRPSKKLEDVKVKSVTKKLKDKSFAAQVNREQILKCEELMGLELNEVIEITLEAMKEVAEEMGL